MRVEDIEELKPRLKVLKAERKITIDKAEAKDAGNYSCGVDGETKYFEVIGKYIFFKIYNLHLIINERFF